MIKSKLLLFVSIISALLLGACSSGGGGGGDDSVPNAFVHTATVNNTVGNYTIIEHPALDGNPDANLLVTQNWNPGEVGGTYNDHAIGVWYTGTHWSIFNQDETAMPDGAAFNVRVITGQSDASLHAATGLNITSNYTVIEHPELDGNADANLLVTQNWNPGNVGGTYNNKVIGVWYTGTNWAIFNQDETAVPVDAAFNMQLVSGANDFVHTTSVINTSGHSTLIIHPALDGNPNAIFQVTQNWNPGEVGGTYNDHVIGVWYSGNNWRIFNQDLFDIPDGAAFNISID